MDLLVPARLLWQLNMHYGADSLFSQSYTSVSACSSTQEDTSPHLSYSGTQLSGDTNVVLQFDIQVTMHRDKFL